MIFGRIPENIFSILNIFGRLISALYDVSAYSVRNNMTKKILTITGRVVSYVIIGLMVAILLFNGISAVKRVTTDEQMPLVLGFGSAVVLTGSMKPNINPDDMVIVHRQESYEYWDVVAYEGNSIPVTHRIIEVKTEDGKSYYKTQGDANNTDDGFIPEDVIIGKVIIVLPGVGGLQRFLTSPAGFLCVTLIIGILFLLPEFFTKKSKDKNGG